ncbi:zinc ribbon domain-containing protein [[Mycobacterium] kokjensenii]|uniref:Zinc ribbon domain-containing protein n=1 Tax=[Mycobacterium] kokjensenii TaxID=3064287 RepID=A0ABM9L8N6_9MYCO|nr:FmdB family zinc ribbon protein [Mycolicibacter sp. MU0083]CAJ1494658.1 zinc ribbon domain-containing protein [Mycolicibacter sp. MU0083]
MPTYSYACTECSNRFDVVQAFTDDSLTTCEQCNGRLRKIFGKVGVVFKGSGFYRTDNRDSGKSSSAGANSAGSTSSGDSSGGSGDGGTKSSADSGTKSGDGAKAASSSTSAPAAASA